MFKNYELKIYKIKNNFQIKNKNNKYYIENYLKNNENVIYNYETYYNKKYKKFFYYNEKKKKYNTYYSILKNNKINNELKKDINKNSLFKFNNLLYIENYIKRNFNYLKKYNYLNYNNENFIIIKNFIL